MRVPFLARNIEGKGGKRRKSCAIKKILSPSLFEIDEIAAGGIQYYRSVGVAVQQSDSQMGPNCVYCSLYVGQYTNELN